MLYDSFMSFPISFPEVFEFFHYLKYVFDYSFSVCLALLLQSTLLLSLLNVLVGFNFLILYVQYSVYWLISFLINM